MKSVIRQLSYLGAFFARSYLLPLYFLSGLVPRRRNLWVFGSWGGHRFADNAAAFFPYCHEIVGQSVDLVWISRKKEIVSRLRAEGFKAHLIWSPLGLVSCLRARLFVFDCFSKDINFWVSRGAIKINLWSGVPLKTFERDIDNPSNRYHRLFHGRLPERIFLSMMMPWHVQRPDFIIAMSQETNEITRRAFDLSKEQVVTTGFPRNDIFFSRRGLDHLASNGLSEFIKAKREGRKAFIYLPTFRDSGKPFLQMDWQRLDQLMDDSNATFFFKFHPVDRGEFDVRHANIVELPQDADIYELLCHADALISDYSSIIFDFMLVNRPILYYTPDLEAFVSGTRALLFNPKEIAVGPVCSDFDELANAIVQACNGVAPPEAGVQRDKVMERLHEYVDGNSNRRVFDAINERFFDGRLESPAAVDAPKHPGQSDG